LARKLHPGQRNSLDALCNRYHVDNSSREYHGALLDSLILADVYIAMTGGQASLQLIEEDDIGALTEGGHDAFAIPADRPPLTILMPDQDELDAHEIFLAQLDKKAGGECLWRRVEALWLLDESPTIH
jgi:DNA polymerase-3 subunit epsilon